MKIKRMIWVLAAMASALAACCQDAEWLYKQGMLKMQEKQYDAAIDFFDKSIQLKPEEYLAWHNRGMARLFLRRAEGAVTDFNEALKLQPAYKDSWLQRGVAEKSLTRYGQAMADFREALQLDPLYAAAYYQMAIVYELHSQRDSACMYYNLAYQYQLMDAKKKVENCRKADTAVTAIHPILRLAKAATDKDYGFTKENPVKVGMGPDSGPANQQRYLELLRDAQGMPVMYKHVSSCCPYNAGENFWGIAMLDQYEITYMDTKGKQHAATVYLNFNEYAEPMILAGFKAVE